VLPFCGLVHVLAGGHGLQAGKNRLRPTQAVSRVVIIHREQVLVQPPPVQVLDLNSSSNGSSSSNLRSADLSYNQICWIRDLDSFRRLSKLVLDGNQIEHIGPGLQQLHCLQHLSLSGNKLCSCRGLEGATGG
jgi:Leucine-rich repeat (LRR) protein